MDRLLNGIVGGICLAGMLMAFNAHGQEGNGREPGDGDDAAVEYGFDVDVNTRYIWRGMILGKGLLVQPSAWISWRGITVSEWNNAVAHNLDGDAGLTEMDFNITYTLEAGPLAIEPSFVYYALVGQEGTSNTGEMSVGLSWSVNDCWSLATSHWVDVVDNAGAYYGDLSLGWAGDVNDVFSLEATLGTAWGSASFNDYMLGIDRTALNTATLALSVTQALSETYYLVYRGEAGVLPDKDVSGALEQYPANLGMGVGAEF